MGLEWDFLNLTFLSKTPPCLPMSLFLSRPQILNPFLASVKTDLNGEARKSWAFPTLHTATMSMVMNGWMNPTKFTKISDTVADVFEISCTNHANSRRYTLVCLGVYSKTIELMSACFWWDGKWSIGNKAAIFFIWLGTTLYQYLIPKMDVTVNPFAASLPLLRVKS